MSAKSSRRTTVIMAGLVSALVFATYIMGSRTQDVGSSITFLQSAAAGANDNVPLGRKPAAIEDGQYPASYFPNTELLGADEMRITALGTGMPNQTRAAVSI